MQNHTLPIQLSPTAVAPQPSRATAQPNSDGPAFSQTLNREMAQRQSAAPQPAAYKAPAPAAPAAPKPQAAAQPAKPAPAAPQGTRTDKQAANDDTAPADAKDAATANPTATDAATTTTAATPASTDATAEAASAAAAAEGAAAAAPMTDMLALVASYKQLMQGGPAKTPAATEDTAGTSVRGKGIAADTQTLAALQGELKQSDDAANGKPATLATAADDATPGAKPRTAPDLAAVASNKTPQSEAALSTLRDTVATAAAKDTAPVTGSAFQAQLSSAEMVQTAVTPASDRIPARLGTTAWDNQVSQKVVWMVGGLDQTASLTLNPPDLGPVQVVLNVNNDQATVAFSSATPEVREALENAMPRLREMLSDAGVTLGEASVSANMPDQRQADTSGGGNGRNDRPGGGNGNGVRSGETEIELPRTATRAIRDDGSLDTFA